MNKVWIERKFVDAWSINHFLFGASLAIVFKKLGFDFAPGLILALAIFIIWEIIELITHADEFSVNRILDVLLETLGFLILWGTEDVSLHTGIILIFAVLEVWGYSTKLILTANKLKHIFYVIYISLVLIYTTCYLYIIKF